MRGLELKPYPPYPSVLCTLYSVLCTLYSVLCTQHSTLPNPYLAVASTTSQAQVATTPS